MKIETFIYIRLTPPPFIEGVPAGWGRSKQSAENRGDELSVM